MQIILAQDPLVMKNVVYGTALTNDDKLIRLMAFKRAGYNHLATATKGSMFEVLTHTEESAQYGTQHVIDVIVPIKEGGTSDE